MPLSDKEQKTGRAFAVEVGIYAVLVTVYFFAVLHYLGAWLSDIYTHERLWYAIVALLLIAGQGIALEMVTTWLLKQLARKHR